MKLSYYFFLFVFLFFSEQTKAQKFELSEKASISLLTCGPGAELYSKFGHSAFRVKDPLYGIDIVYNYGTFDFNTPNFYTKFAQGKLLYQLGRSKFNRFVNAYKAEGRWVKEQKLNLPPDAIQQLFAFLENNAKPENRKYKYDFFFDNCATKMREVIEKGLGDNVAFQEDSSGKSLTFRASIQQYLNYNSWGSFGIDIALGSIIDREATQKELYYLPDYVAAGFEKAIVTTSAGQEALVMKTEKIIPAKNSIENISFLTSPVVVFALLLLLILWVTAKDFKKKKRTAWIDLFLFGSTGLAGMLIAFLWFGTDHTATANNFNLLWAFPLNLLTLFLLGKHKKWTQGYLKINLGLLVILVILWVFKVQVFPPVLIAIIIALAIRYSYLVYYYRLKLSSSKK